MGIFEAFVWGVAANGVGTAKSGNDLLATFDSFGARGKSLLLDSGGQCGGELLAR